MDTDAKKSRNEYYRNWRAKNRDKVKAAQDRYWAKKAAEAKGDHTDGHADDQRNSSASAV